MRMRTATAADIQTIARLQVASWRSAYRDILEPNYLIDQIEDERLKLWTSRLAEPRANHIAILAEIHEEPIGFVCAVGGEDKTWGTLIDNLHVVVASKGQGVGRLLFKAAAEWSLAMYPDAALHLWCFTHNTPARSFYERLGGVIVEEIMHVPPGGGASAALRYFWSNPALAFDEARAL